MKEEYKVQFFFSLSLSLKETKPRPQLPPPRLLLLLLPPKKRRIRRPKGPSRPGARSETRRSRRGQR